MYFSDECVDYNWNAVQFWDLHNLFTERHTQYGRRWIA